MAVLFGMMAPHPPLIVPAVGRGAEAQIADTAAAFRQAAERLAGFRPDTVVIISPHSVMYRDYFHISPGPGARGDFRRFGAGQEAFRVTYDEELALKLAALAEGAGLPAGMLGERDAALDHGFMVPLYFLRQAVVSPWPFRFLRAGLSGLPFRSHYRLGRLIGEAAAQLGRRICIIASGDLSHYGRADGPYGFRPEGPEYDSKIMDIMGRAAFDELLALPEDFCERAGECGQRSFLIMAGALDGRAVKAETLSYQGVTGVGYGVILFTPGDPDETRRYMGI